MQPCIDLGQLAFNHVAIRLPLLPNRLACFVHPTVILLSRDQPCISQHAHAQDNQNLIDFCVRVSERSGRICLVCMHVHANKAHVG